MWGDLNFFNGGNMLKQLRQIKRPLLTWTILSTLALLATESAQATEAYLQTAQQQNEVVQCAQKLNQEHPGASNEKITALCAETVRAIQPVIQPCEALVGLSYQLCMKPRMAKLDKCRNGNRSIQSLAMCARKEFSNG